MYTYLYIKTVCTFLYFVGTIYIHYTSILMIGGCGVTCSSLSSQAELTAWKKVSPEACERPSLLMMKSINFPDICVCVCRVACRVWLVTICGGAGHFFIHVSRKDAQSSYIVFNYFYKVIYASYTGSLRSLGNHIKIFFTIPPGVVEITWLTKTFFYLDKG